MLDRDFMKSFFRNIEEAPLRELRRMRRNLAAFRASVPYDSTARLDAEFLERKLNEEILTRTALTRRRRFWRKRA